MSERQRRDSSDDDIPSLLGKSFSLHPITQINLFAGRRDKLRDLTIAVSQDGQHPIIYGERGVGKTSLANIVAERNQQKNGTSARAWTMTAALRSST
jgi:ABC-type molybdenum transport system ATPase subunit/photorepair protein PhrA